MRRLILIIVFLYSAISTAAASKIQVPESAKAEILKINSGSEAIFFEDFAIGDLDADGIDDIVVIIKHKEDDTNLERLIVLTGTKEQKYNFSAQTKAWEENMRRTIFLSIKKSSIFIASRGSTGDTYFGTEYQFKKRKNDFLMIGVTNTTGTINSDNKREESFNLINSKTVITVVENGKRVEFNDKLSSVYKIKLDEFSLDNGIVFR